MVLGVDAVFRISLTTPSSQEEVSQIQDTALEGIDLAAPSSSNTSRKNRPRPSRAQRRANSCPTQNMMFEIQIDTGMGRMQKPLETLNESVTSSRAPEL